MAEVGLVLTDRLCYSVERGRQAKRSRIWGTWTRKHAKRNMALISREISDMGSLGILRSSGRTYQAGLEHDE